MMEKNAKIYVAGHRGMVGSAIVRELQRQGYTNIITRTHKELDLTRQDAVEEFFAQEKPEYVFLEERLQEAGVPRLLLHLPPLGSSAHEGRLSADQRTGKDQRGLCTG